MRLFKLLFIASASMVFFLGGCTKHKDPTVYYQSQNLNGWKGSGVKMAYFNITKDIEIIVSNASNMGIGSRKITIYPDELFAVGVAYAEDKTPIKTKCHKYDIMLFIGEKKYLPIKSILENQIQDGVYKLWTDCRYVFDLMPDEVEYYKVLINKNIYDIEIPQLDFKKTKKIFYHGAG